MKGGIYRCGIFENGQVRAGYTGTLFLDEASEIPISLQVKLQEKTFERVGGTRSIRVDVRIIATTNQNLETAVLDKRFRKDLFYRLNVIPVDIPPLRNRKEDVPSLLQYF